MAEKARGWTLWSRSGYRGPSELNPRATDVATVPSDTAAPAYDDAAPGAGYDAGYDAVAPGAANPSAAPAPVPRPAGAPGRRGGDTLVDRIIDERSVHIEFQAVHDAESGQIVAFEALSRGPQGPLQSPLQLFGAARAAGRLGELDWVCRAAAFRAMLEAGLPSSVSLLVNADADSLIEPCPADLLPTVLDAERKLRVFVDITGRAVSRFPCHALETARRARAASWGVSINDIEFSAAGTTLLPTLEPDVVKLNHNLITSGLAQANTALMAAIAEGERTGAALLVERVENTDAAMMARAAGARYQQGYLLGKPGPLPAHLPMPQAPLPLLHVDATSTTATTPWRLLSDGGARTTSNVSQAALDHLVMAAATQAGTGDHPPVVAAVSAAGADLPAERQVMFSMLLERCPLIVILGHQVSAWSDWRVRAADLPVGHALADETCFLLLSPTLTVAVAARRHPHNGQPPVWDLAVTLSPGLCRAVMRHLLGVVDTLAGGVHSGGE